MKVTIRDSQILKTIEPGKLAEHLQMTGWHQDHSLNHHPGYCNQFARRSHSGKSNPHGRCRGQAAANSA